MRRTQLDANTFQNNAIAASATNPKGGAPRPNHYLDQYGFELDGPVLIPKLLKKDAPVKLFYMGAFENYREGTPNPLIVSWPQAEMRTGDFSKMKDSGGQPIPIYDPFTATYDASGQHGERVGRPSRATLSLPAGSTRLPRQSPSTCRCRTRQRLRTTGTPPTTCTFPSYFDKDKFYNLILKFDWNFGDKHRAFFRHASNDRTEDRSVNGIDNKPGTDGQQPFQRINDAYVADWVGTVSPTFILNARVSYNRFIEKGYGAANTNFDLTSLGISSSLLSQLPSPVYFGRWDFDNYNSLGRSQSNNFTDTYQAAVQRDQGCRFAHVQGRHRRPPDQL